MASVVVCTFNRANLLRATIEALRTQAPVSGGYEVIVVDNNSSDDTRTVAEQLAGESAIPIRYLFEPNQGLSFARNAGVRIASGEIVAFVDDDVHAERGWLRALVAPFRDGRVACAGGPIRPIWPFLRPAWLTKDWEGYLGINEFDAARDVGEFRGPIYPWGGNIAFRREVFDTVGMFPTELGRKGTGLLANEEVSLCRRIEKAGKRISFVAAAVVYHRIHPERLTKQAFYHRAYAQGRSEAIVDQSLNNNESSRLGGFASSMFWAHRQEDGDPFDRTCRDRVRIGYLSQVIGLHDDHRRANEFRKLRALKTFLLTLLRTSAEVTADARRQLQMLESLVRERDTWLTERDAQIVSGEREKAELRRLTAERQEALQGQRAPFEALTVDRDGWQRVALERQAAVESQNAVIEQLNHDRDDWQRLALSRGSSLAELRGSLWTRIGLRLALLKPLSATTEEQ